MSYGKVRLLLVVPLCLVFVALGCTKNRHAPANLKGTVSYKGAPVTGGNITLYSKDNNVGAISFPINPDGTYEKTALPTGEMTVCVETETLNPNRPKMEQYGKDRGQKKGGGDSTPEDKKEQNRGTYVKIPPKYVRPTDSPEKVTLQAGDNVKNLELKD